MKKAIYTIILPLTLIVACSPNKTNEKESAINSTIPPTEDTKFENKDVESMPMVDTFRFEQDSVILPTFEISLKLSGNAEKKLKNDKESIIVSTEFFGEPIDTTLEEYQEWGKILIGISRIELFDSRVARFENVKISRLAYDSLTDKNFEVLVNIFTGRRSSGSNLLNSDILQEGIDSVKGKRHVLKASLIYGD